MRIAGTGEGEAFVAALPIVGGCVLGESDSTEEEQQPQVMSEVHVGQDPATSSCLSVFAIAGQPLSSPNVPVAEDTLTIFHQLKTSISHVGLQVWRGSLLLSDFLIHKIRTTNELDNVTALELGAGTGLAGIVLAQRARLVFLTDRGMNVLNNCYRNANLNLQRYRKGEDTIRVRELDWQGPWPPPSLLTVEPLDDNPQKQNPYSWTRSDFQEAKEASVFLAADVIYSDDLTEAFFSTLQHLMPPRSNKVLLLVLEKRFNFSLNDLDVVAHGYSYFRTFFHVSDSSKKGSCENQAQTNRLAASFFGRKLKANQIPQYIGHYERTCDLELWEIQRL